MIDFCVQSDLGRPFGAQEAPRGDPRGLRAPFLTYFDDFMLIYGDLGSILEGRFGSILELFSYTFLGSLFMLIYVDLGSILELI